MLFNVSGFCLQDDWQGVIQDLMKFIPKLATSHMRCALDYKLMTYRDLLCLLEEGKNARNQATELLFAYILPCVLMGDPNQGKFLRWLSLISRADVGLTEVARVIMGNLYATNSNMDNLQAMPYREVIRAPYCERNPKNPLVASLAGDTCRVFGVGLGGSRKYLREMIKSQDEKATAAAANAVADCLAVDDDSDDYDEPDEIIEDEVDRKKPLNLHFYKDTMA